MSRQSLITLNYYLAFFFNDNSHLSLFLPISKFLDKLVEILDEDGDGEIDYSEFVKMS